MMLILGCSFVSGMLGIVWVGFGVGGVWQSTAGVFWLVRVWSLRYHNSRYVRSSERRKMSIKFSFWRIRVTVKLQVRRGSRRKNSSRR